MSRRVATRHEQSDPGPLPLELMRRVVELYNQNAYLRSRLSELQES